MVLVFFVGTLYNGVMFTKHFHKEGFINLHCIISIFILTIIAIAGCASPATPTPEVTQDTPVAAPAVNPTKIIPTLTTETTMEVLAPSVTMEVGSTYYYVDGTTLVAVPAGEFSMGGDGKDNPVHTVSLGDYWIYSTKVTNQQYAYCEATGTCTSPNLDDNPNYKDNSRANDPVVGVTYDQAVAYCGFVHGRLPTEAEWEKSARNPDGSLYPWGDGTPACDLLNFNNCVGNTTNVINYRNGASYYGGLEMAGNVFEWVADWYGTDYYASSPKENPQGPSSGISRSVRSSSYISDANQVSLVNRAMENPQNHRPDLGFRCVVDDPTYFALSCSSPLVYGSDVNGTSQPVETCPVLGIKQAQFCSGETPATNVTFSGPADAKIDASNCTPSGNPDLFTCQKPQTIVSITAACQNNLTGNSLCPDGFSPQGDQCVADGSAGQCLNGTYDSSKQCCTAQPLPDFTSRVCPVGTFYSQSKDACLSTPVKEIVTVTDTVELMSVASCKPVATNSGSNTGPTACAAQVCVVGTWDSANCCCVENGLCY